jgi:hypothetical protein
MSVFSGSAIVAAECVTLRSGTAPAHLPLLIIRLRREAMATHWPEIKEHAKRRWGKLPDGRFEELERRRTLFVSLLQIFHGMARQDADREIDRWSATTDRPAPTSRSRSW